MVKLGYVACSEE